MKNTKELKLIDGHFSPDEAREILMNAFTGKIDFHENKNFSSEERFGTEDATALKRIPELLKSMDIISKIIEEAKQNNETLQITSEIQISLFKS
ncbi:MAG: 23S rRNA G2445 N2-methylase RlmL [Flavobacterium sp.]|jgi:23S rRNA G2445 N2-methylase RlmL